MRKLLVVDDEDGIRDIIKQYAEMDGFKVVEASDGKEALEKVLKEDYHAVILDVMMPGVDGWTVLREIRRRSSVPVLMLTARGEEYDRIFGFELGADDYIVKPFSPREVMVRIHAIARRGAQIEAESDKIRFGDITIEEESRTLWVNKKEVALTPKEFDLMLTFAKNPGRVLTREQLLEKVWGYDYFGDVRTVDTHIKQLRERLGEYRDHIATVWGTGYKFVTSVSR